MAQSNFIPTERFLDAASESKRRLSPVHGYELKPLVSLEEAVRSLESLITNIQGFVWTATGNCEQPKDGLTLDESAAVYLYTMECMYRQLNTALRSEDRQQLVPYFSYLKLFLTALWKLKNVHDLVFRGVKANISDDYPKGKKFAWWGLSSTTTSLDVLQKDTFLGEKGPRTLFNIQCFNGKMIQNHSQFPSESEVLLLPCSYFEVMGNIKQGADLRIIHLKQIEPPVVLIQPPFSSIVQHNASSASSISNDFAKVSVNSKTTATVDPQQSSTYKEPSLSASSNALEVKSNLKTDSSALSQLKVQTVSTGEQAQTSVKTFDLNQINIKKPFKTIKIAGMVSSIAASDQSFLHFNYGVPLSLITHSGEVTTIEWDAQNPIWDICWSTHMNVFLFTTAKEKLFTLDEKTKQIQVMYRIERKNVFPFYSVACYNNRLLLSHWERASLEEYDLNSWKLTKSWSPLNKDESVDQVRFNKSGELVGLIIKSTKAHRFELRNSHNMEVINTVMLDRSEIDRYLSLLPNNEWLIIFQCQKTFFLVDQNGQKKQEIEYSSTLSSAAVLFSNEIEEKWRLVIVTGFPKRELRLYDL